MRLNFQLSQDAIPAVGRYVYVQEDYAIAFEIFESKAIEWSNRKGSVAIGNIELTVDIATGLLRYASGFCPKQAWTPVTLPTPDWEWGSVFVESVDQLIPGVTRDIDLIVNDSFFFDNKSGWLCIGAKPNEGAKAVRYLPNSLVVFQNNVAVSVWLQFGELV
jgi:hypothetical protein